MACTFELYGVFFEPEDTWVWAASLCLEHEFDTG